MCPHTYSYTSVLIATTINSSTIHRWKHIHAVGCTPSYERCVSPNTVTWQAQCPPPKKIEFLMCCTLNFSASGRLRLAEGLENETLTPAEAEPAMCPHIYYCVCLQEHADGRDFLLLVCFEHQLLGPCLFHARRYREWHRCVCACLRACVCVCVCVCCTYVLTFSVCLSGCFVCVIFLYFRGTKYISVLVLLYF